MSKIFDALRKAEREKGRPERVRKGRRISKKDLAKREALFLRGVDESFRRSLLNLRNSIDSEMKQKDSRIVMFTSAVGGEGKTTITAFLARVMALNETERILLVDCSLQNPQLHDLFGVKNDTGLLEYLAGKAELPQITKVIDEGVFDLVTTGEIKEGNVNQPLFNSERMTLFFKQAAENYDYVLIDSSAVLEAPETSLIASGVDGIVMVIHAGKTKREVIKRAMMMVEKLEGRIIGTVLNRKRYYIPEFIYRRV